jgi:hypothetical protein
LQSFGSGLVPSGASRFSIAGSGHLFGISGYRRHPSGRGGEAAYKCLLRRTPVQPSGRFGFALGRVSGHVSPGNGRLRRLAGRERTSSEERASRTGVAQSENWPRSAPAARPLCSRTEDFSRQVRTLRLGVLSLLNVAQSHLVATSIGFGSLRCRSLWDLKDASFAGLRNTKTFFGRSAPKRPSFVQSSRPRLQGRGSRSAPQMPIPRFGRKSAFGPRRDTLSSILAFGPSAG